MPVQALRIAAALAVTLVHAELMAFHLGRFLGAEVPQYPLGIPGNAGVDLFFVISGFVMVHSSRALFGRPGGRALFVRRRLIRIVPMYWLATLVLGAWMLRFGPVPDAGALARSLLFWPFGNAASAGRVVPLLEPGWTLDYEMLFYLLFAASMAASARATTARVTAVLVMLVAAGAALDLPQPLAFWTRPIVLEFAAGAGLALLHRRGLALPAWLRLLLLVAALALLASTPPLAEATGWITLLHHGGAALALMAAAVLGPLSLPRPRLWDRLGDVSYALYLWHLPLMIVASYVLRWLKVPYAGAGQWLFIAGTTAVSLAAALVIHVAVERPLTRWLNRRFAGGFHDRALQATGV